MHVPVPVTRDDLPHFQNMAFFLASLSYKDLRSNDAALTLTDAEKIVAACFGYPSMEALSQHSASVTFTSDATMLTEADLERMRWALLSGWRQRQLRCCRSAEWVARGLVNRLPDRVDAGQLLRLYFPDDVGWEDALGLADAIIVDPLARMVYTFKDQWDLDDPGYGRFWEAFVDRSILVQSTLEEACPWVASHTTECIWDALVRGDDAVLLREPGPCGVEDEDEDGALAPHRLIHVATVRNGVVLPRPPTSKNPMLDFAALFGFVPAHVIKNWNLAAWFRAFEHDSEDILALHGECWAYSESAWCSMWTAVLTVLVGRLERLPGEPVASLLNRNVHLVSGLLHAFGRSPNGFSVVSEPILCGTGDVDEGTCVWEIGWDWVPRPCGDVLGSDLLAMLRSASRVRGMVDGLPPGIFEEREIGVLSVSGLRFIAEIDGATRLFFVPISHEWAASGSLLLASLRDAVSRADPRTVIGCLLNFARAGVSQAMNVELMECQAEVFDLGPLGSRIAVRAPARSVCSLSPCKSDLARTWAVLARGRHHRLEGASEIERARVVQWCAQVREVLAQADLWWVLDDASEAPSTPTDSDRACATINGDIARCLDAVVSTTAPAVLATLREIVSALLLSSAERLITRDDDGDWADNVWTVARDYDFSELARIYGPFPFSGRACYTDPRAHQA